MEKTAAWKKYRLFLQSIPSIRNPEFESTHWGTAIKKFTAHKIGQEELSAHVEQSEFGFPHPSVRRDIVDALRVCLVNVVTRLTRRMSDSRGKSWEHARAIYYLKHSGRYGEYRSFLKRFRIGSDMQTARHYNYLQKLRALSIPKNSTILEVGAGAGNLAVFSFSALPVRHYIIVDLPEMLPYAAFQCLRYAPRVNIRYPEDWSSAFPAEPTLSLLTPAQIAEVSEKTADILLNFTSFSEMEREEVERYFREFYRIGKQNSIFYNVNRIKNMPRRHETYINNPFLFSYRENDVVLEWGLDDFHHRTRGGLDTVPTLTVSHIARINP